LKKVGVIIFIFCIVLALGLVFLRRVHITRKNTPKSTPSVVSQQEGQEVQSKPIESQTPQKQDTQQPDNKSGSASANSVVLDKVVAEEKLDYSGADQTTIGQVESKNCYLQGTQIVYCANIKATMGTSEQIMKYYCTYSTYESLQVGQALSVIYKQTTANTYGIMSVQLANG